VAEIDGGKTTSNELEVAVVGEPAIVTVADMEVPETFWFATTVVQLTLVVPSEKDLVLPSLVENPLGSARVTEPELDKPETVRVKLIPFITVPDSAPD
jgi:hypothetical protein